MPNPRGFQVVPNPRGFQVVPNPRGFQGVANPRGFLEPPVELREFYGFLEPPQIRPFHKTLPRFTAFVYWISVRFYETDCT